MSRWTKTLSFLFSISLFFACFEPTEPKKVEPEQQKVQPIDTVNKTEVQTVVPTTEKTSPKSNVNSFTVDELMGKITPSKNPNFSKIAQQYTSKKNIYMRSEAYQAFQKMATSAKEQGINLKIISATRPFSHQKNIWEAKWMGSRKVEGKNLAEVLKNPVLRAEKILEYSSMPGTSRHHWGTDIDLNSLENSYFHKGEGKEIYDWLSANASSYGFAQAYTSFSESRPYGYQEEKWHWSYTPISKVMTQQYKEKISDKSISGFKGSEIADSLEIIKKYVLGVAPECK